MINMEDEYVKMLKILENVLAIFFYQSSLFHL